MIKVSHLGKNYGDRQAISGLSFTIQPGEVVGFLGPNGAGKTTTMKIITGFMPASNGQVLVDGDDVFENPLLTKSKIGYLPENPPVYTDMTVFSYLKYVAQLKKVETKILKESIEQALNKVQLQEVSSRLILNLSKGFRQRVGIAAALVSKPKILILDEPTVGLDPNQVLDFRKLILSLKGEHTILLSTHILSEVQATCDRIIIINRGEIVAEETLSSVHMHKKGLLHYQVTLARKVQTCAELLNSHTGVEVTGINGHQLQVTFESSFFSVEELASVVVNMGAGLLEYSPISSPLDRLFSELTQNKSKEVSL